MKISIETVPYEEQRYDTWGDWWFEGDDLVVKVSKGGDWRSEFLVGLHEAVEAMLCKEDGITGREVTEFDLAHPDSKQPGEERDAPYHAQHFVADICERIVCKALGMTWEEHEGPERKL